VTCIAAIDLKIDIPRHSVTFNLYLPSRSKGVKLPTFMGKNLAVGQGMLLTWDENYPTAATSTGKFNTSL